MVTMRKNRWSNLSKSEKIWYNVARHLRAIVLTLLHAPTIKVSVRSHFEICKLWTIINSAVPRVDSTPTSSKVLIQRKEKPLRDTSWLKSEGNIWNALLDSHWYVCFYCIHNLFNFALLQGRSPLRNRDCIHVDLFKNKFCMFAFESFSWGRIIKRNERMVICLFWVTKGAGNLPWLADLPSCFFSNRMQFQTGFPD